ncbi:hypothetical protein JW865_02970 [Candidatus Bathyarchaeota archaeon]|nr:hypothetical protein [Candidatus Bathyarchaeota archaeon]
MEEFGLGKAAVVAAQALKLGYLGSHNWGRDPVFARYWAFMKMYTPIGFST